MNLPEGNILLTGATGFLGFRILERLVENSFSGNIIAAGRVLKPHAHLKADKVHYRMGDLSDSFYTQQLFEQFPITHIINCAALSSPWGQYKDFFRANVLSQEHLIHLAEKHGVKRFVHISTPSLYFDYYNRRDIKESDPLPRKFVNHYAATKREAEILLERSSLQWVALRPRALVGRGDTVIMPRVIRAYDEGKLRIIGNGGNLVDITPVANVVDAVILSLTAPDQACGKQYNIANGAPVKLWTMLADVLRRLDRHLSEKKVPLAVAMTAATLMEIAAKWTSGHREPALTRYSVGTIGLSFSMDISLAQKYLGYSPRQSVEEAMDEFVEWYKNG